MHSDLVKKALDALSALAERGDRRAVRLALEQMDTTHNYVRGVAVEALETLSGAPGIRAAVASVLAGVYVCVCVHMCVCTYICIMHIRAYTSVDTCKCVYVRVCVCVHTHEHTHTHTHIHTQAWKTTTPSYARQRKRS